MSIGFVWIIWEAFCPLISEMLGVILPSRLISELICWTAVLNKVNTNNMLQLRKPNEALSTDMCLGIGKTCSCMVYMVEKEC